MIRFLWDVCLLDFCKNKKEARMEMHPSLPFGMVKRYFVFLIENAARLRRQADGEKADQHRGKIDSKDHDRDDGSESQSLFRSALAIWARELISRALFLCL